MKDYILYDKILINGRERNIYKKNLKAKTIYIRKNNEMVRFKMPKSNEKTKDFKTKIHKNHNIDGGWPFKNTFRKFKNILTKRNKVNFSNINQDTLNELETNSSSRESGDAITLPKDNNSNTRSNHVSNSSIIPQQTERFLHFVPTSKLQPAKIEASKSENTHSMEISKNIPLNNITDYKIVLYYIDNDNVKHYLVSKYENLANIITNNKHIINDNKQGTLQNAQLNNMTQLSHEKCKWTVKHLNDNIYHLETPNQYIYNSGKHYARFDFNQYDKIIPMVWNINELDTQKVKFGDDYRLLTIHNDPIKYTENSNEYDIKFLVYKEGQELKILFPKKDIYDNQYVVLYNNYLKKYLFNSYDILTSYNNFYCSNPKIEIVKANTDIKNIQWKIRYYENNLINIYYIYEGIVYFLTTNFNIVSENGVFENQKNILDKANRIKINTNTIDFEYKNNNVIVNNVSLQIEGYNATKHKYTKPKLPNIVINDYIPIALYTSLSKNSYLVFFETHSTNTNIYYSNIEKNLDDCDYDINKNVFFLNSKTNKLYILINSKLTQIIYYYNDNKSKLSLQNDSLKTEGLTAADKFNINKETNYISINNKHYIKYKTESFSQSGMSNRVEVYDGQDKQIFYKDVSDCFDRS